ncbi:unnamed protein product, partial [marine sediment metagenome]
MSLMEKVKGFIGMGKNKQKRTKKEVYEESSNKTQVLLRILKSYGPNPEDPKRPPKRPRPRPAMRTNPRDTGTLGRY